MRTKAMLMIGRAGGKIKYGHAEAGSFTKDGYYYEQHEIEFCRQVHSGRRTDHHCKMDS